MILIIVTVICPVPHSEEFLSHLLLRDRSLWLRKSSLKRALVEESSSQSKKKFNMCVYIFMLVFTFDYTANRMQANGQPTSYHKPHFLKGNYKQIEMS